MEELICEICGVKIEQYGLSMECDCGTEYNEISKPKHYNSRGGIEPIDFTVSNNMNFLEGSIIKYLYRYKDKGGVQSLEKAEFYLKRLIKENKN